MHREELVNAITEPMTLADAKKAARVEHDNDDAYVTSLITTARKLCEAFTLRRLVAHKFEILFERDEVCPVIQLEDGTKIASVDVFELTNTEDPAVITPGVVDVDFRISKNRILLDLSTSVFDNMRELDALRLQYTTGVEVFHQSFKTAMEKIITSHYENRETTSDMNITDIDLGAASALLPFKIYAP